ncbi:Uncharacterised protein [Mycobacteroides abscessus subsp. abscessus]|nr:Uncharacterised protein [Mycobacteroides abscessus subsp. abscessus]
MSCRVGGLTAQPELTRISTLHSDSLHLGWKTFDESDGRGDSIDRGRTQPSMIAVTPWPPAAQIEMSARPPPLALICLAA